MTQSGARAASDHRGQPAAFPAETGMPNCENAAVNAMETTGGDPPTDAGAINPSAGKLAASHNSELSGSDPGDGEVRRGGFVSHSDTRAPQRPFAPGGRRLAPA